MSDKLKGILHQCFAYVLAIAAAWGVGLVALEEGWHWLWVILAADLVGTLVIFVFARVHNNSSLYDPYWSLAPIVIVAAHGLQFGFTFRSAVVSVLVIAWGARLTGNFLYGWPGLHHEDWRYAGYRERMPKLYWLVSLGGFHLVPTLLVYAGCLAIWPVFTSRSPIGPVDALALVVTLGAIVIETVADVQLHRFVASGPEKGSFLKTGLWRYSRHPNYFGELSFWWGLWIFGMAAAPMWWTLSGPVGMTLLFFFASLPLIDERHLRRRPAYADHITTTNAIIPWFPKG